MLIKVLVICFLIFILINLFRALPIMLKGQSSQLMSHNLGWRIGLSICLFMLLILALATGIIEPNPRPY